MALIIALTAVVPIGSQTVPTKRAVQTLQIGSFDNPESVFGRVVDVAPTANGGVLVLDMQARTIRAYSRRGSFIREFGKAGQGPGEFMYPEHIGVRGGRIWVTDPAQRRITYFLLDGTHVESRGLRFSQHAAPYGVAMPVGPMSEDKFAARLSAAALRYPKEVMQRFPIVSLGPRGETLDTLAWIDEGRAFFEVRSPGRPGGGYTARHPLGFRTHWAPLPLRGGVVVVDHDVVDGQHVLRTTGVSSAGDTMWSRAVPFTAQPVSRQRRNAVRDRFIERLRALRARGVPLPGDPEALVDSGLFLPTHLPSATDLVVAQDDSYIVQREPALEGEPQRWTRFKDDQPIEDILVPPSVRVLALTRDVLWGVWKDEYDVEYIVRLEVSGP